MDIVQEGAYRAIDVYKRQLLKPMTASFGITALNELQELYNGKSIREDGEFALEVMRYINKKVNEYKEEDGILYAIYGTPAELSLIHILRWVMCGTTSQRPCISYSSSLHRVPAPYPLPAR